MKFQNCKSDSQTNKNQYFLVPCEPDVVRVEKLKIIYEGSSKSKQRVCGKSFVDWVDTV